MKLNEMGYIEEISLEEAVEMINCVFRPALYARQSGKSRMCYNQLKAWLKVCEVLNENGLLKGDEDEQQG
jgi:hypothetical protein